MRKLYRGAQLSSTETEQLVSAIEAISAILADVPRLEPVTRILRDLTELARRPQKNEQLEARVEQPARLLHAVIDLDALESSGQSLRQAVSEGDGDPVLMGMIRAIQLQDSAAIQQLGQRIACKPRSGQ